MSASESPSQPPNNPPESSPEGLWEPFALTSGQQERLLTHRAAREEGEDEEGLERLRQREEDQETLRAFAQQLEEANFARGGRLTRTQMSWLLALARSLAPNPNLDARLLRRPDEPDTMNRDLYDLLYGAATPALRLRQFLTRRHAGGQTALQLLCAAFPTQWPLITPVGLKALDLTPAQWQSALETARRRFDLPLERHDAETRRSLPAVPASDPVLRLMAQVVVYEAVRETLQADDFVSVHRLLTQEMAGRPSNPLRHSPLRNTPYREPSVRPIGTPSNEPPGEPTDSLPADVREPERPGYEASSGLASEAEPVPAPDIAGLTHSEQLARIEQYVIAQGFTYPPLAVRDYYLCLQARSRLTLLSGLSGTGKTRLTALFAEAMTGDTNLQYRLLPVRPDWTDSSPLLGYMNLLARGGEGRYVSTPFLDFLRRAAHPQNAWRAHFLCLDEINLARVEHYFAEILSALETPNRDLLLPDGQTLRIPANLFITGTLNVDEGTHTLSRKVLDRANTILFNEVFLQADEPQPPVPVASEIPWPLDSGQALFLLARVQTPQAARQRLKQFGADFAARVVDALTAANAILEPHDLHFAYRVRDEALIYCANSFDVDGSGLLSPDAPSDLDANLRTALDLQLVQKALPRLTGSQEQIEPPVRDLLRWATQSSFPRTAQRLTRLLTRLQRDGFVGLE